MIVYLLLFTTLLIAALSMYAAYTGSRQRIARLLFSVSLALFIYLFGAWVFLSVYTKYVFAALYVAALVYGLRKPAQYSSRSSAGLVLSISGTFIFSVLSILYFTGTTGKPYGVVNLSLPFMQGRYFVFQGGKGLPTNLFHYKLRGAVFAMDIIKLNSAGERAKHIFSTELTDYEIYADTLLSPCAGTVVRTESDNPDNIPPSRKRGPTNTNCILLETDSFYVFMGHLKPGCVFVHEGDMVKAGQPIGCCGNSGFSLEPHLHIQAHAKTNSSIPWYKEKPLLIKFEGVYYSLFEEIYK